MRAEEWVQIMDFIVMVLAMRLLKHYVAACAIPVQAQSTIEGASITIGKKYGRFETNV